MSLGVLSVMVNNGAADVWLALVALGVGCVVAMRTVAHRVALCVRHMHRGQILGASASGRAELAGVGAESDAHADASVERGDYVRLVDGGDGGVQL